MARIGDDGIAGGLGHVFMLHFRKDGSIAHYQSFIRYFTLKQWLRGDTPHLDSADAEATYIYDAAQVLEFFDELETVLSEKKWTATMDQSYAVLLGPRCLNALPRRVCYSTATLPACAADGVDGIDRARL